MPLGTRLHYRSIVEVKSVERLLAVHKAQARTYLRLTGLPQLLLLNFNVTRLKDGLRSYIRADLVSGGRNNQEHPKV